MVWKDDLVIPYFSNRSTLLVNKSFGRLGSVHSQTDAVLAHESYTPHIFIMKEEVVDELKVLHLASDLTGREIYEVENTFKTNHPADLWALVGRQINPIRTRELLPGLHIIDLPYVSEEMRQRYPGAFSQIGGKIEVVDRGISHVLQSKQAVDGRKLIVQK